MTPLAGPILTAAAMRAAEEGAGVGLDVLMERAGAALGEAAARLGGGAPVLVICGCANNGGDGYVAARWLAARGIAVRIAAIGPPKTDLAKAARARWEAPVERLDDARSAPVLVDALFGTGVTRPLEADLVAALRRLRSGARLTIAADVPSGVRADDGTDLGCVGADVTLAFAAAKPAHLLQPAAALCGRVLVADIGVAVASDTCVLDRPTLAPPGAADHKYTRGMVAVVPGNMRGAASLSVRAAAPIAGYTILCGTGDAPAAVVRRGFAAVLGDARLGAMLIGPGLAATDTARTTLDAVLASQVALVLDAGALALVTPDRLRRAAPVIVTPHEGEFTRLFGVLTGSKADRARVAAATSGAVVILKGSDTVIAAPDGRVTLAPPASAWLATAGSGDVLAGIAAALLARGLPGYEAACAAVWMHGEAARRAGPAFIADELSAYVGAAFAAACR